MSEWVGSLSEQGWMVVQMLSAAIVVMVIAFILWVLAGDNDYDV